MSVDYTHDYSDHVLLDNKNKYKELYKLSSATASDVHTGDYYPVKWTVTETVNGSNTDLISGKKLSEVATYLNSYLVFNSAAEDIEKTYALSWAWAFDQNEDAKDTELGDAAANSTAQTADLSYTLKFKVSVTVEQTADDGVKNS